MTTRLSGVPCLEHTSVQFNAVWSSPPGRDSVKLSVVWSCDASPFSTPCFCQACWRTQFKFRPERLESSLSLSLALFLLSRSLLLSVSALSCCLSLTHATQITHTLAPSTHTRKRMTQSLLHTEQQTFQTSKTTPWMGWYNGKSHIPQPYVTAAKKLHYSQHDISLWSKLCQINRYPAAKTNSLPGLFRHETLCLEVGTSKLPAGC